MLEVNKTTFVYKSHSPDQTDVTALHGVDFAALKGEFIAVLGRNGSGKSTFARLLNALLLPSEGSVIVKGMDTRDEKNIWEIRRTAGMVFQNPDNQIVGTTVEEDVAFGPENLGIEPSEIRIRVDGALDLTDMTDYAGHSPHLLSGGQKQKVAIAGILAMKPECIILDEASSMLDPSGRRELMQILRKLNTEEKITIIHITHNMDEAKKADRIIVMDNGAVVLQGTPAEVFSNVEMMKGLGLDVPQVTELFYELNKEGLDLPNDVLSVDEAFEAICGMAAKPYSIRGGEK